MDFTGATRRHDLGNVMSPQPPRHQDDDVRSPALHEPSEGARLGNRRISARRQNPVIAQLHQDIKTTILVAHLVEAPMESQRRILGDVAQAGSRPHVDSSLISKDTNDETKANTSASTKSTKRHNVGGDAVNFFARMHKVSRARAHEHLNAASRSNLEGGAHLVEGGGQSPARQVSTNFDAIGSPVTRTARTKGILNADFHDGHGCHLS